MGIIEESKRSQSQLVGFWRSKKFITLIVFILFAGGAYAFWPKGDKATESSEKQLKEWTVKNDDIVVSVEADGQVLAEDGVELSFAVNDDNLEVKKVFVKEGDTVKKGDQIASVKTDDLQLSLSSAWANYQSALADYNETLNGATDKQIAEAKDRITSAELSLSQSKISLANTKQSAKDSVQRAEDSIYDAQRAFDNAEEKLDNNRSFLSSKDVGDAYEALVDTLKSINISLEGFLKDSDGILGIDDETLNDKYEEYIAAKDISILNNAKASYRQAKLMQLDLDAQMVGLDFNSDYAKVDQLAKLCDDTLGVFEDHLYDMKQVLDASITSVNFTQNTLDGMISKISSNRSSINTKITSVNNKIKAVDDARDNLDDYLSDYEKAKRDLETTKTDLEDAKAEAERSVKNSEASLASHELSLVEAKRDLDDLTAPLTTAEKASANSRLNSASVSLKKAQNNLKDATIISPIDGQIVELNYKTGDIIVDNKAPVAVIMNSKTLFVQVNAEEADVSRLKVGQKAIATFDALDGLKLNGEISFISLISQTSNNGIVTYEVKVVIDNPGKKKIREGMTVSLEFVLSEARDVLTAPVSAVRNVAGKPSVQNTAGEWLPLTTGFTDGKYVEIISGVKAGEKLMY